MTAPGRPGHRAAPAWLAGDGLAIASGFGAFVLTAVLLVLVS